MDPSAAMHNPYANPYAAAAYWAAATPYMMAYAQTAQTGGLDAFAGYPGITGLQSPTAGAAAKARNPRAKGAAERGDEGKLFIGGLPNDVQEQDIRTVFSQVGTVKEVHIMSGRSQSCLTPRLQKKHCSTQRSQLNWEPPCHWRLAPL